MRNGTKGGFIRSCVQDRAGILRRQKDPAPTALLHESIVVEGFMPSLECNSLFDRMSASCPERMVKFVNESPKDDR